MEENKIINEEVTVVEEEQIVEAPVTEEPVAEEPAVEQSQAEEAPEEPAEEPAADEAPLTDEDLKSTCCGRKCKPYSHSQRRHNHPESASFRRHTRDCSWTDGCSLGCDPRHDQYDRLQVHC